MNLQDISLQSIIDMALEKVDTQIDRRVGSVIYDSIAAAAVPILYLAMSAKNIDDAGYIMTSYGEYLDNIVAQRGLERLPATKAIKTARIIPGDIVPLGARFSTVGSEPLVYRVVEQLESDKYLVECETTGSVGNAYFGALIPISVVGTLESAEIINDYQVARDIEIDEELRKRYLTAVRSTPFGGNISQYIAEVKALDGVGDLQIYRAYPTSGHICISVIGNDFRRISNDLIADLQESIDPSEQGTGLGIAPIFHKVKVVTPTEATIPISFDLNVLSGYTVDQMRGAITERLEELFLGLRKAWGSMNPITHMYCTEIYISRIISTISGITGVNNISNVKIQDRAEDLVLEGSGESQILPVLGEVTINGN